jgi:hypothetical protein
MYPHDNAKFLHVETIYYLYKNKNYLFYLFFSLSPINQSNSNKNPFLIPI